MTKDKQEFIKVLKYFITKILILVTVCFCILNFVIGIKQIHGIDMYPHLKDGDLVLYSRLGNDYSLGDAVIYLNNGELKCGRLIAEDGNKIELTEDGMLKINGNLQHEDVFYPTEPMESGITYPYTVKKDNYFILSDYRINGSDSRETGCISKHDIKGKVITILRIRGI